MCAIAMAWGGWLRRWISDDGLIVLRTVRNLLAGNGPVFNVGERVEANTSTAWQYVIWAGVKLTGARPESAALILALGFSTLAVGVAACATGLLATHRRRRDGLIMVPVGLAIYIALPPARDFATSGLEWGLGIAWVSVLWLGLVVWVRARNPKVLPAVLGLLSFWAGLSWLIRPELALYGGLTGLYLMAAHRSWRAAAFIAGCGLPLPLAYQIFRMGYYGLLTPHTAVAKSASETDWSKGWAYFGDFVVPYQLWIPAALALVLAVFLVSAALKSPARGEGTGSVRRAAAHLGGSRGALHQRVAPSAARRGAGQARDGGGRRGVADRALSPRLRQTRLHVLDLRTPAGVTALILMCAALYFVYVLRVGGDFMHGRMWLIVLFTLLLPFAVVPVADLRPQPTARSARAPRHSAEGPEGTGAMVRLVGPGAFGRIAVPVASAAILVWSGLVAVAGDHADAPELGSPIKIIDEREFWTAELGRPAGDPPIFATDFLAAPSLRGFDAALSAARERGDAQVMQVLTDSPEHSFAWITIPRSDGTDGTPAEMLAAPTSLYLINLGMTSMNAPLDVRVLDTFGLATPLAARQPRDEVARVGHNKSLPVEWMLADGAADLHRLPVNVDPARAAAARQALQTEEFQELFESYRAPLSLPRFLSNIGFALTTGRTLELDPDPAAYLEDGTESDDHSTS